jgi:carbamoyl-phosphate synthase small subunit
VRPEISVVESSPPALLVLEDGRTFCGRAFGAIGETFGEAVFATGMSGYQETLTDPSYYRQVVIATAPHIGNTGWNDEDNESARIWVAGYVVRDAARISSNWRSRRDLDVELRAQGVVGMCDVDTRALTRHIRERGAMRVGVSSVETNPAALLERVQAQPSMVGAHLADEVSTTDPYVVRPNGEPRFRVAAIDLGIKSMTPVRMAERGLEVHVVPSTITFAEIEALHPDGVFFSNGPGDPAAADGQVDLLKSVLAVGLPYLGICFGNQLFGRALGFGTFKLGYGHRGINQPVMDLTTRRVEVTAHNHGFAVAARAGERHQTPYGIAEVSHICLNDDVVEGLQLTDPTGKLRAFSVQYHPEAAAGPHDASYLFDRFVDLMALRQAEGTVMRPEPVAMRPEPVEGRES